MKKSLLLALATAVILSSCGTLANLGSSSEGQRFQDGIYGKAPSFKTRTDRDAELAESQSLVDKTKGSTIYLFGDKKDSIIIPESMSASIRYDKSLASTVVTVGENPYAWQNNIDPWYYYTPYSIGSSWYWSRHYSPYYSPWGYSPYWSSWAYGPYWNRWGYSYWSCNRYFDPWYYDPWYYGGWYDPWYYGGFWGASPWYGWYPHYAGWYG